MVKMGDDMVYGGVAAGTEDDDSNVSGFMRWEHDLTPEGSTLFLGVGRAERSPDFWERDRVFDLDTEKNTQFDIGVSYRSDSLRANVALFYADISDYILITGTNARNIDATTYGGEADLALSLSDNVTLNATIAYLRGDNDTDNTDLAQMAPMEGTVGISYDDKTFSAGAMLRMVDRQDRIDIGSGTIYSADISETPGFSVLSVNAGYRQSEKVQFTAGIDNLLDKNYSEHLGKGSADLGAVTGRVNEPGMTGWVKAAVKF
jgi:iron complex outermembrane receptor protein